ncbi:MAG: glutathione synthetase [Alphaproteobacteria bacterium]|jgi:glutathione synthase/RimK-type ligase-like ATP-grasp enzyme|nr:glutathione synthetase [Alphaproteobacteria bacterium]
MAGTIVLATSRESPDLTVSDRLYADALERRGYSVIGAPWEGPRDAFAGAAAVVIRATWGYYRTLQAFREWTEAMARTTRLFNSIDLIHWNLRKDYVGKLETAGIRVPRSRIVACDAAVIEKVFAEEGWDRAVVKPATGASGYSVELLQRATLAGQVASLSPEARASGVVVQEFLPEIAEGELSLVYFDGAFSHAIRKRPPPGEFRSNSRYGPTRTAETPPKAVTEQGAACLAVLPEMPLYARIDGVMRGDTLIVIEVEVLEPALFMEFDPPSAERFAAATVKRLG